MRANKLLLVSLLLPLSSACADNARASADEHAGHALEASATALPAQDPQIPADAAGVNARLAASPRHGEWAMIPAGGGDSVRAWVVYPERNTPAPVVLVVHEIFGLSNWVRGVADQLAADGFIAIAPDLLTGHDVPEGPDGAEPEAARTAIRDLQPADVQRRLEATANYGMALPAAARSYGIVGFCWGGSASFAHAVHAPGLGASVVYYGTSPPTDALGSVRAPVLGLYGGDDARVNATIEPAATALQALGRTYEHEIYPGAGHGFLRQQDGREGANLSASRAAWQRTTAWFREHLES
jgi:carboxymethylenebutenolidase